MQMNAQRGQTLPFWAIGVLIVLSLLFFLANYVTAVAWNIRAQNAADSAASTALTVQANVFNEESTLLYAAAIDENRLRYLNQAILNTIAKVGGCATSTCNADYLTLVSEYKVALNGYTSDIQLLNQADQLSTGGQQNDEKKAIAALSSNCTVADCAFTYTVIDASLDAHNNGAKNQTAPQTVDIVACKNVSYFAPQLLKLASGATFQALGRAAAVVIPSSQEAFTPGTSINASTGQVYQPLETQWATSFSGAAYDVDFSGLTVDVNWYTPGPVKPYAGTISSSNYGCS